MFAWGWLLPSSVQWLHAGTPGRYKDHSQLLGSGLSKPSRYFSSNFLCYLMPPSFLHTTLPFLLLESNVACPQAKLET